MNRQFNIARTFAVLALAFGSLLPVYAEAGDSAKPVETRTFHGKVHSTTGRATIYQDTTATSSFASRASKHPTGPMFT